MPSMQFSLPLVSFEYEHKANIRTVRIDDEPWFYALDVCTALGIANSRNAVARLDGDDVRTTDDVDPIGRKAKMTIVNESGLYGLVFESRTEESTKFKRWITSEVLPQIRKTGAYALPGFETHAFVRRFNDNWERVESGYFSIISELYIRVYGKFEHMGHRIAETAPNGKQVRPDVSVGQRFPKFLEEKYPHFSDCYKMYNHIFVGVIEVPARQYENQVLPAFIEFVETVWLKEHAYEYLEARDPKALEYLPRLLQEPTAQRKFTEIKDTVASKPDLNPKKVIPQSEAKKIFSSMREKLRGPDPTTKP